VELDCYFFRYCAKDFAKDFANDNVPQLRQVSR
jgi:hypothetical protein